MDKNIYLFLETGKTPSHNLTQLFKSFEAKYGQCACENIWNGGLQQIK